MLDKLERKIGKYAIPNLINYLIGGYLIGYLLTMMESIFRGYSIIDLMTLEPFYIIHNFQFWRVITWVLIPPSMNLLFAVIMMFFYWQLGNALERIMGTFRFNVYIFGGILFTVIGAFVIYGILAAVGMDAPVLGRVFSTYYINLGIFLAFAILFPEERILLYFFIPIKMKWLAAVDLVIILLDFINTNWIYRTVIIASLLNVGLFFLSTRNIKSPRERARQAAFRFEYNSGQKARDTVKGPGGARHKCDICGRTEVTNPELEFRYCSKCQGNHEYCNDHLFTHAHIK